MTRVVVSIALAAMLGGCGGSGSTEPRLPAGLAAEFASAADDVAARSEAGDACAANRSASALQRETIAAINAGRVSSELQEPLLSRVNELELSLVCPPRGESAPADSARAARGLAAWLREHARE